MQELFTKGYKASYIKHGYNKLLVSAGDSWPAGHGSIEIDESKSPKEAGHYRDFLVKHSYPYFIHQSLADCDFISLATPGAGVHSQYEAFKHYLNIIKQYDTVIVLLGIDSGLRHPFQFDGETVVRSLVPEHGLGKEYFMQGNFEYFNELFCSRIFDFQCMCDLHGFEFWFTNNWLGSLEPYLSDSNFKDLIRFEHYIDFAGYGNARKMLEHELGKDAIRPCHHPTEQGHKYIAQWILNHWKSKQKQQDT